MLEFNEGAEEMPATAMKKKKVLMIPQREDDTLQQRIRERAYQLFEDHGREHGHDVDDWLRAEAEVLNENTKTA